MQEVDEIDWPKLANLLDKINQVPSMDIQVMRQLRAQLPQPTTELENTGIAIRKGKVKRKKE